MKYFLIHILVIVHLSLIYSLEQVHAQSQDQQEIISGKIIDDSTFSSLVGAHIFNESLRTGSITNEEGNFIIRGNIGDTLVVSAVGYFGKVIRINNLSPNAELTITLIPQRYEIEEVKIHRFGDYAEFQKQLLALELPKTQLQEVKEELFQLSGKAANKAVYDKNTKETLERNNRGEFLYHAIPLLSRDDKRLLNYSRNLATEKKQRIIDKKYNREIIYEITKLSEDEITDFMSFCNFSTDYLFQASEYEILVRIEEKYIEYLKQKSRGELLPYGLYDLVLQT